MASMDNKVYSMQKVLKVQFNLNLFIFPSVHVYFNSDVDWNLWLLCLVFTNESLREVWALSFALKFCIGLAIELLNNNIIVTI